MGSYKTTILGILVLISAITSAAVAVLDSDPATVPDLQTVGIAFAGVAAMFARDNNVTSEEAGAK